MANPKPVPRTGKPNKNRKFLLARLQDIYGEDFHPIMKMAENANRIQELIENLPDDTNNETLFVALRNAIDSWEKIAQYTEPKLKAVEVKHTTLPKVKLVDLTGKPPIDENVIDADDESRTTDDTDQQ